MFEEKFFIIFIYMLFVGLFIGSIVLVESWNNIKLKAQILYKLNKGIKEGYPFKYMDGIDRAIYSKDKIKMQNLNGFINKIKSLKK